MSDPSTIPPSGPLPVQPVIAEFTWTGEPDATVDDATEVRDGLLVMHGNGPATIHGYAPLVQPFRDVIVDAVVRTDRLRPDEGFGIFVRRNEATRYIGARITPERILAISAFDGAEAPVAAGTLAEGMVLHPDRNRITIAAVGPSITFSLNSMVVTSILVDPRYVDGYCGLLLEQRHDSPVEMAVEWIQFRTIW